MDRFKRSDETSGWPDPVIQTSEIKNLTDAELANYISSCGYDYDGMGVSVREALVRLLQRNN